MALLQVIRPNKAWVMCGFRAGRSSHLEVSAAASRMSPRQLEGFNTGGVVQLMGVQSHSARRLRAAVIG
eukprot:1321465-Pyramimonas_sp.AAC.1